MITFSCSCGQLLQVQDQFAGRQVQCPKCQGVATAPSPQAVTVAPVSVPAAAPPPPARRDWDDERSRRRRPERDDDYRDEDYRDDDRPRRGRPAETSGKAMAGMIFGLVTFVLPIFCAIPALILSILGLRDIKQ